MCCNRQLEWFQENQVISIRTRSGCEFSLLAVFFFGLALNMPTLQAAPDYAGIRKSLQEKGRVVICVVLADAPQTGSGLSVAPLEQRTRRYRASQQRFLAALGEKGYSLRYRFRYSPVLALELEDETLLDQLSQMESIRSLRVDQQGGAALLESRQLIRANEAQDLGISGVGRTVAVLDSGVDNDHPDLVEGLLAEHGKRFLSQGDDVSGDFDDDNGHGTHVSGILASRGHVTTAGIAPGASIIPVKVLDNRNVGWFTDWAAGIEYAVSLHQQDNGISIDVINMSLASHSLYTESCEDANEAIAGAVAAARELGVLVLAASGNNGSLNSLALPSCMQNVVSVGSIHDTDPGGISAFTNRSPLLELLAPGETIISAGAGGGNETISGTSQAAPHIAGAICLMLEANPRLSPEQLVGTLKSTGISVTDDNSGMTIPRLDCLAAVELVRIPPVSGLSCVIDSAESLVTTWAGPPAIDAIEVTVLHEGLPRADSVLEPDVVEFRMNGTEPGTYEVRVVCLRGGLRGPTSSCILEADAFQETFTRGNCNSDGAFDLTDAIFTLNTLFFAGAGEFLCEEACDSNDDGELNITDAIFTLSALFLGTSLPPEPYPSCGYNPKPAGGESSLACEQGFCPAQ